MSRRAAPDESPVQRAWASVPAEPGAARAQALARRIAQWLSQRDAVLVAHYYAPAAVQDLAQETGGIVADSLEMARFGRDHPARTLVVAGVRFMGETARILCPDKTVLMPDLDATCSLDLGCPADAFSAFCDAHPDRTVVVYANTSAAVKARADWVVTSRCAVDIVGTLAQRGERILWAPDQHLGRYVQERTGADMLMWEGACIVHEEFRAFELGALREEHPGAVVLAHPEASAEVLAQAHVVGSTSVLLEAPSRHAGDTYIVATDAGLLHAMRRRYPGRRFLEAPTAGNGATCKSCAHCPWMAMNGLEGVARALHRPGSDEHLVRLDPALAQRARRPIERMLDWTARTAGERPASVWSTGMGAV